HLHYRFVLPIPRGILGSYPNPLHIQFFDI
ncbi:MAG: hypothetical protein ACI8RD_007686, partial [Bacillariaceae sp.]